MKFGRRGELTWDTFIPWMIAILVLVLIGVFAFLLKDELAGLLIKVKNIWRS